MASLFELFFPLVQINTVDWVERSTRFYGAVLSGNFAQTYQKYHPGVTLMWVVGFCEKLFSKFTHYQNPVLDYHAFPNFIFFTGFFLLFVYISILILSFLILKKHFGKLFAFFSCFFMLFEPFLFGFARSVSPDALLTALSFLSLILFFDAVKSQETKSFSKYALTGVAVGLLLLTKITLLVIFPALFIYVLLSKPKKSTVAGFLVLGIFSVISFILFFPAMWADPINTILKIFREGVADAPLRDYSGPIISEGLNQNILAKKFLSYPLHYIFRVSPLGFVLSILGIFAILKKTIIKPLKSFILLVSIFLLIYFLSIALPNKQIYKYVLPLFIGNSIFSSLGVVFLINKFQKYSLKTVLIVSVVFLQLVYFWFNFPKFLISRNPLVFSTVISFVVSDFETTGFHEASLYLNAKNLPDNITVATYPNKALESLTNLTVMDGRFSKDTNYSLVPRLYRYPYGELLDISGGCFLPEREFEHNGSEYLVLYRNVCKY